MNAIEIQNIRKTYGTVTALDSVSFDVPENSLFGLIGPDGSGKSSLYNILTTLKKADSGTVKICGYDVVRDYRQIRATIGYMPERFSLYSDLTVDENLNFFASLFAVKVKDNYDLIAPVFDSLARFGKRRAGALSGGMKQKLALSCALIHRPKVLLLDEPTTGVDAVSRSEFWDMLGTLKSSGITILVSTSYMDEAERCERIALINAGRILDINTPNKLIAGVGDNLYSVSADNMYGLLACLRAMSEVTDCYTFGASLHAVVREDFNPNEVKTRLMKSGMTNVSVSPAVGTIEDLFIKFTNHEQ